MRFGPSNAIVRLEVIRRWRERLANGEGEIVN